MTQGIQKAARAAGPATAQVISIATLEKFIPAGWMTKIGGALFTVVGLGELALVILNVVNGYDLDTGAANAALAKIGVGMAVVGGRRALEGLK